MNARDLMLGDWVIDTEFGRNRADRVITVDESRVWLAGGWEIVLYLMCIYIAIDAFCTLPKVLKWILDKII